MSLVAIANAVTGDRMIERFHADPRVRATELLLQERVPRQQPITRAAAARRDVGHAAGLSVPLRRYRTPHTVFPHTQFLSNGKYTVGVTNAGGGASIYDRLCVTRSRRDATLDPGSHFIYLRDIRSGAVWSPTFQPTRRDAERVHRDLPAGHGDVRLQGRGDRDPAGDRGVARARRRGARPAARQPQRSRSRDRRHQLRRSGARPGARRFRASGVRQVVHRNRVPRRARRADLPSPPARRARSGHLGGARPQPRRPAAWPAGMGDRSGALHRPRPHAREPDRARRPAAVGRHRLRARSDPQPAAARARAGRRIGADLLCDRRRAGSPKPPRRWRRPIATPARRRARSRSPRRIAQPAPAHGHLE